MSILPNTSLSARPTRIWYFTDPHGSVLCYSKILAVVAQALEKDLVDAIVVGGDLCGRELVPIVRAGSNEWSAHVGGGYERIGGREELAQYCQYLAFRGAYPFECETESELRRLEDAEYSQTVLDKLAEDRVKSWLMQYDEIAQLYRPNKRDCKIILNTGTSDSFSVDKLLSNHPAILFAENRVHELPGNLWMASTSYREWSTLQEPSLEIDRRRKLSPSAMRERIRRLVEAVPDLDRCIFNFHVPPYGTSLDQVQNRQPFPLPDAHSGSKTIAEAIDFLKPLASLHGYVHDARAPAVLGRTHGYNPGTEYYRGLLDGVVLEVDALGHLRHDFTNDPWHEASSFLDDTLCLDIVKALTKNLPGVGWVIKTVDDIAKAIQKFRESQANASKRNHN